MRPLFIYRNAARDLCDYWAEADVYSDDSAYAQDNEAFVGAVREAGLELQRALNDQGRAVLQLEVGEDVAAEIFDEARNRLTLAQTQFEELHPHLEESQSKAAWKLVRAYRQLLRQK